MARREDTRPRSEQVAAQIRAQIIAGDFAPGDQLPATGALVELYDIANTTVQKALNILKHEGWITAQRGKGVYVADGERLTVHVGTYFPPSADGFSYELLNVSEVVPPAEVARALNLGAGERAVQRKRLMRHRGDPVELDYSYYSLALVAGTDLAGKRRIKGGAPRVLAELGHPERRFSDRVSVRMPTTEEIEILDLPEVPVFRQFRTVFSDESMPVAVNIMIKGGHRYDLVYWQTVPQATEA